MEQGNRLLTEYDPSLKDKDDFRCGNSMFSEDVWDYKGFVDAPHWNDAKFKLNFKDLDQWTSIKLTVKQYIAAEILSVGFNSVKRKLAAFNQLRKFLLTRGDVLSFLDFSREVLIGYFNYLLDARSERDDSLLNGMTIKKSAQVVKELLQSGSIKGWSVYPNTSFVEGLYEKHILKNKRIRTDTKFGSSKKELPEEEVMSRVIELAQTEADVLTGTSIILQTQLGIRISEALSTKEGCIKIIGGDPHIEYIGGKTKKERITILKPVNSLVVKMVERLEEYTRPLRLQSGSPYLFLDFRDYDRQIVIASFSNWTKNRIRPFLEKNNLRKANGKLVDLSSHHFRHLFATKAIEGGMPIHVVADMLDHASIQMTETYNHAQEKLRKVMVDVLSGEMPVSSTNKVVLEALKGQQNPFKGKTTDQMDKMRRAMKIEILPHGLCLHHPLRGDPCAQDGVCLGCNYFLAPAEMLPQYEARLARVNQELQAVPEGEKSIYNSKLRYQAGRLQSYIQDLSAKLAKKQMKLGIDEAVVASNE
ncbi:site-specific integrase [Paenibacillus sp. WQ 127069]|uniref:Site-specific integrase n=1 Tax=Paenibacillus baimaensis TaxID=2982185 RepID=A0ABT2UB88_9BACL|nr:site-specific integrase [Paenibacillus sp. WQ 127069]MCU6791903.1 site-specific integrase [Paenibacillus sp. WQ 127069]